MKELARFVQKFFTRRMRMLLLLCGVSVFLLPIGSRGDELSSDMRPALLGTGPRSLINLIDTQRLMKRGQGDAVVRFSCGVAWDGTGLGMITYLRTPHSDALAEEAIDRVDRAAFVPAFYKSRRRTALVSGTIIFVVIGGKPHLRIFLNQEEEHIKRGDDFICPQQLFLWKEFDEFKYSVNPRLSGRVAVQLNTDATGKLLASKVTSESPAGWGFGDAVMKDTNKVRFLPGFLHGKPIACTTTWQILFRGWGRGTHWDTD